jgi:eukaryotic-like serine/threonine-protein kinase
MSDQKNEEQSKTIVLETTSASINVEITQKIEFDYAKVVGNETSKLSSTASIRLHDIHISNLFNKKPVFNKKIIPDDYVKASSIACVISSISALEGGMKLQDINDNYILKQKIAEGSQGVVLTGFDKSLKRNIIVKTAKDDDGDDKKHIIKDKNYFVSEARIMAQLDHPSITPIYGMFSDSQDKLHLTMKHIHGKTLNDYLQGISVLYQRDGVEEYAEKDSILTRIEYLIRVCEAVDYAHCKGVIHRDLKPENIIIGSHGEIYVMDWGLACLLAPDKSPSSKHLTEIGLHLRCDLAGTPCYIAPELIRGGLTTPQSDIFSLGMILFEIITLMRAVPGKTINEVFKNIINQDYNPFKHRFLKNKLSDDLQAIIAKATSPSLERRYQTASDMARDLKNYLMHKETSARPDNFLRKTLRGTSNHAVFTSILILTTLLCLTIVSLYGLHSQNLLINRQKTRESILTNFQYEVIKRSNKLNYAMRYFENQLTNLANHSRYVLNAEANTVNADYIYSLDYAAKASTNRVNVKDSTKKSMGLADKKKIILSKILKHMLTTSNLKFKKQAEISDKQIIVNKDMPIIGIFVGFKDGSILSYQGNKEYSKKCNPNKRLFYKEAFKNNNAISWSKPFNCVICSKIIICCIQHISDEKGNTLGIVGMDIDLEYIQKYLFKNTITGMKEFLINKNGEVILANNFKYENQKNNSKTEALILKKFSFNKEFQKAVKNKEIQFRVRKYKREYIFGINYIPSLNYYYIEQTSERKLWEDYNKHAQ